jgi:DNA-binding FadR family transcriptional regulator
MSPLAPCQWRAQGKRFSARLLVEVRVTGLAAERHTEDDLRRIEAALEVQESNVADTDADVEAVIGVASSFNLLIAEAAHNEVLAAMIGSFVELMKERGPRLYALPGFDEWDLKEHRGINDAVREQDAERASNLMREHILWPTSIRWPSGSEESPRETCAKDFHYGKISKRESATTREAR